MARRARERHVPGQAGAKEMAGEARAPRRADAFPARAQGGGDDPLQARIFLKIKWPGPSYLPSNRSGLAEAPSPLPFQG